MGTPEPLIAWNVVLTLGVLLNLLVGGFTLIRMGNVQKREVTFGEEFVTSKACDTLRGQIGARISRTETDLERITHQLAQNHDSVTRAASARSAGIYAKVDQVQSALRGEISELRHELGQKIDSAPAAIITILKNTGAIK